MSSPSLLEAVDIGDSERRGILNSNIESTMEAEMNGDEISDLSFKEEAYTSLQIVGDNKLNWLLLCGPVAFLGSYFGILGETSCFCLSGLALIPCSERLSFVTEQLAEHTNETIGALLNATFGNAPEFLISSAALRSGYYRVVQLTLLGSILSNLLFVFGLSCLVGGMQWQVQELRITSGNASIGMLLTATMGMVLPTALKMMNNQNMVVQTDDQGTTTTNDLNDQSLTENDVAFSRFNSVVMMVGYISYMIFQLGSHKNEFDCNSDEYAVVGGGHDDIVPIASSKYKRKRKSPTGPNLFCKRYCFIMNKCPRTSEDDYDSAIPVSEQELALMSIRMGLIWLAIITMSISIMSDVIVDSIDGFAGMSNISEEFTSVIIIPYFSNIAAQVSSIIFAYRNKMDLCVGITVGSAVQIAQCVLPGCVIVGWFMDRPMTLYYQDYETACLLLGVLCVAVVLQGGTTNWLVGIFFVGVYLMIAAGFWCREEKTLSG